MGETQRMWVVAGFYGEIRLHQFYVSRHDWAISGDGDDDGSSLLIFHQRSALAFTSSTCSSNVMFSHSHTHTHTRIHTGVKHAEGPRAPPQIFFNYNLSSSSSSLSHRVCVCVATAASACHRVTGLRRIENRLRL